MPKIQWERLPRGMWAHLRARAQERQISEEDLYELAAWKSPRSGCPGWRLVQRLRNLQAVWLGPVPEHVPPGWASCARQAAVNASGIYARLKFLIRDSQTISVLHCIVSAAKQSSAWQ